MSANGPKDKDTDKIKFFKVDPKGDIAAARPEKDEMPVQADDISQINYLRPEPLFSDFPLMEEPHGEVAPASEPEPEPEIDVAPPAEPEPDLILELELELPKPTETRTQNIVLDDAPKVSQSSGHRTSQSSLPKATPVASPKPSSREQSLRMPLENFPEIEAEFGAELEQVQEFPSLPDVQDSVLFPIEVSPDPVVAAEEIDSALEEQLDILKPQIDDISRQQDDDLTNDQVDLLKKYISLKEAEARDLKEAHRQYRAFLKKMSGQLETHSKRSRELLTEIETVKRRDETLRSELRETKDRHHGEVLTLKNDYEEKLRKSGNYEAQVEDLKRKREEWQEKVREDLKRIKLKERELENKYELLKRDTQALLDSKDKHVLELKKKNDALELELETLEERLRKGNTILGGIESKKKRLVETLKLAITLLEVIDSPDGKADGESDKVPHRKAG